MPGELFDEMHEAGCLGKDILRVVVVGFVARRIAPQSEDVADTGGGIAFQDFFDFRLVVPDAREVGDRVEAGGGLDPHHELVGHLARRAAGPVGHAHERRLERLELPDVFEELVQRLRGLRREELERERRGAFFQDIGDVHGVTSRELWRR